MRSRRITSIALSTLAATGGLAAVQPGAAHAATGSVTPTFNANEVAFQGMGAGISGTNGYDLTDPSLTTTIVNGAPQAVTISFGGSFNGDVSLAAPVGQA